MNNDRPEIMTIGETAQYLRISSSSLYKYAQAGKIPCQKIGRHWRFHRGALDRWLQQTKSAPDLHFIPQESETTP